MNGFDTLTTTEKDKRLAVLNALLTTPHRKIEGVWDAHKQVLKVDPHFYAHLAYWYQKNGKVRDHQEAFLVGLWTAPVELKGYAAPLLDKLPPYQVERALKFMRKHVGNPSSAKRQVKDYLIALQGNEARLSGAIGQRKSLHWLMESFHIRPTPLTNELLFGAKPQVGTQRWAVGQLAKVDSANRALLITQHRIPFAVAVGALGADGMTPEVLLALIEVMSPQEVANMMKRLQDYGAMDNVAARTLINDKIAKLSKKGNALKLDKAMEHVKDESIKAAMSTAQTQALRNIGKIDGRWAIVGDRSGSMHIAIELMKRILAVVATASSETPLAYVFDDSAMQLEVPSPATLDNISKAFAGIRPGGQTACGSALALMARKGQAIDGIVIITDEGDNCVPLFEAGMNTYRDKMGYYPEVVVVRCGNPTTSVQDQCRRIGVAPGVFDFHDKDDYNGLTNLLPMLKPGARWALLEQIYETPLA